MMGGVEAEVVLGVMPMGSSGTDVVTTEEAAVVGATTAAEEGATVSASV
jgi:hypothetical protein